SLMELARKKGATKTEIDTILDMQSKSSHRTGVRRTYRDLVNKKFDITKVIRIVIKAIIQAMCLKES
ncbi:MAG TPA: hypothetical protein VFJ51_10550, partial [Nitrososphaeraceae archaeon]|nr:hypothetical protein [Nitrososphaeraceae archaeon]